MRFWCVALLLAQISFGVFAVNDYDLTPEEEKQLDSIFNSFSVQEPALDDQTVLLTPQMARCIPNAMIRKMIAGNEAYIRNPELGTEQAELDRLQQEINILRDALGDAPGDALEHQFRQ